MGHLETYLGHLKVHFAYLWVSRGTLGVSGGPLGASGGPIGMSGGSLASSGRPLGASGDTSGEFQNYLKGLRTLKGDPKFYQGHSQISLADFFNIVNGLKIKHSISMCLLVFERAYLNCFLTNFRKIYDGKKLEKKIFKMRLISGL